MTDAKKKLIQAQHRLEEAQARDRVKERKARSPEDQGFLSNVNRGRVSRPLRRGRKA